jgi:hypothetical protein
VQVGQVVVGRLDGQGVAEAQALHDRQVHLEELRHQRALDGVARVGGAALLGVLEALGEVGGELVPLREVPDPPGVEALLLEEVALAGVGERRRRLAAVGPAADEGQAADLLRADEDVTELRADAGQQRHGQPRAPHDRVREGQRVEAALRRRLRDDAVAGQALHELGVDLHAHRVVPRRDVAHRTGQRAAPLQLPVDLAEVPADAVQRAVDVGAGQLPRLADLPRQQQRERVAHLRQAVDGRLDARLALVQVDAGPRVVLAVGVHDRRGRLVVRDARRPLDRCPSTGVTCSPARPSAATRRRAGSGCGRCRRPRARPHAHGRTPRPTSCRA